MKLIQATPALSNAITTQFTAVDGARESIEVKEGIKNGASSRNKLKRSWQVGGRERM